MNYFINKIDYPLKKRKKEIHKAYIDIIVSEISSREEIYWISSNISVVTELFYSYKVMGFRME